MNAATSMHFGAARTVALVETVPTIVDCRVITKGEVVVEGVQYVWYSMVWYGMVQYCSFVMQSQLLNNDFFFVTCLLHLYTVNVTLN